MFVNKLKNLIMKKILYKSLVISSLLFISSCTDKTSICIEEIKICLSDKLGEECFSKSVNKYCGTNFDPSKNQWWYDMQNWAKESETNKNKLIQLSKSLNDEATKLMNKDLKEIAGVIEKDILR